MVSGNVEGTDERIQDEKSVEVAEIQRDDGMEPDEPDEKLRRDHAMAV